MLNRERRPRQVRLSTLAVAAVVTTVLCGAGLAARPVPARAAAADGVRTSQQWVLDMLNVPAAWPVTEGGGVTVAVIDSGVNPDVSDLTGQVITGPNYTGVGTTSSSPDWGVHGTWMASLIVGHGHDGGDSGVIGIAPKARVLSIRVIPDRQDPDYSKYEHEQETRIQQSLADGISYAVAHGAQVISMSIGYSAPSGVVREALKQAYDHGVVVLASAGNSGQAAGPARDGGAPESFPADYPGVISVAAVKPEGKVAPFSSDNLSVQVAAPGVGVPAEGRAGDYWLVSGTSPACALVAGVAALIKSRYPGLAPDLVASALTSTTTDRPAGGYNSEVGFGVVDADAALIKAGKLAHPQPVQTGVAAAVKFRGTLPPAPVHPRGLSQLVLFIVLALASLALMAAAAARLAALRRPPPSATFSPSTFPPPPIPPHSLPPAPFDDL